MKDKNDKYHACPNCGEELSIPEYDDQECYECGWPDPVDSRQSAANSRRLSVAETSRKHHNNAPNSHELQKK